MISLFIKYFINLEYEKAKKEFEENARKQIEENEKQMEQMKKTYEQKLAEALALAKVTFIGL